MSISKQRAGRKSWETRVNYAKDLSSVVVAIAAAEWKYGADVTKKMIIERTAKETGKTDVITFSQAYAELSGWLNRSFANRSEMGFSDMLAESFFQSAVFHTPKAEYRLWVKPEPKAETLMICINDRQAEFKAALARADKSDLEVFADFERDSFVVVNRENKHEYKVILKAVGGKVLTSCEQKSGEACADFKHRNRICKHQSAVLRDCLCDILAKFSGAAAISLAA